MNKRLAKRKLTQEKRKNQSCKVYSVKIDRNRIGNSAEVYFSNLFKEAKWFYNYCLSLDDINDANTTIKSVFIKAGDLREERIFNFLQAQMKQAIKARLFGAIRSLNSLKEKGLKVGKIKFKSTVNSITLTQFNKTYFIEIDRSRIRIQGLKKWLKVRGLEQIPKEAEIANAVLLRKNGDLYLNITTYIEKERKNISNSSIGIDFGCESQLSLSNGIKIKFEVKPSKRLRRLDRKIMSKNRKRSNNKEKDQLKRRKELQKLKNKKKDIKNKLVTAIASNYKYVCFQEENINQWKEKGHGRKIQNTGIGKVLSDLKHKAEIPLQVNRFFPSTQLCPICEIKNKLSLDQRTYSCNCGFKMDRDIKSASCIKQEAMKNVPMDCREFTLGEILTTTLFDTLNKIHGIEVSKLESSNQEAF